MMPRLQQEMILTRYHLSTVLKWFEDDCHRLLQSLFPPVKLRKWYQSVIEEVLEERVVSSRGRKVERGVRQRFAHYPTRKWGPTNQLKNLDYQAAIEVKGAKTKQPSPSLIADINAGQEAVV